MPNITTLSKKIQISKRNNHKENIYKKILIDIPMNLYQPTSTLVKHNSREKYVGFLKKGLIKVSTEIFHIT